MKTLLPTCLLLAPLCLTGCLRLEQTLTLRQDASAAFELAYSISEPAVAQVSSMLAVRDQIAALSGDVAGTATDPLTRVFLNPTEDGWRRELRRYEKDGISIERLKVSRKENWRNVILKLNVRNLADAARADFFPEHGFALTRDRDGNYVFFRDAQSRRDASSARLDPETLRLISPLVGGFNAIFKLVVPGRVLSANTPQKSLYSAVYTFNLDRDPHALTALQEQQVRVVFSGQGQSLPQIDVTRPARPER